MEVFVWGCEFTLDVDVDRRLAYAEAERVATVTTEAAREKDEVGFLENQFAQEPSRERLLKLLDAYVDRRQAKSLERALSLILQNLEHYKQDPGFLYRAASLLTLIQDNPSAAILAAELANRIVKLNLDEAVWYGNAAYVYWRLGNVTAAIEASEIGVGRCGEAASEVQLKANLAYYYAERGLAEDASRARQLAEEAYYKSKKASLADTLGYVLLRFAAGKKDVELAQTYFRTAKAELERLGSSNPLLEQHMGEAAKQLEKLQ